MTIEIINQEFSICKLSDRASIDFSDEFCFVGKTDEEFSLVCNSKKVPETATERDDGWKAFRIQGKLDFSLLGIIAKISGILAAEKIGIFVISTYHTDYILTKKENFEKALSALMLAGYSVVS